MSEAKEEREETAVYIVMRSDLSMPRGKEIAQAIHAVNAMDCEAYNAMTDGKGVPVICVRADSEEHLRLLIAEAFISKDWVAPVIDAGRTVFEEPTLTCAAVGPIIKGSLPLLAKTKCY